jgi:hypothetical protein
MRLVCKRWDAAVFSEPAFWRSFTLTTGPSRATVSQQRKWISHKLRLLHRVAGWVGELHVTDWSGVQQAAAAAGVCLEDFVAALQPGSAGTVSLASSWALPETALDPLVDLVQMTSLQLCTPTSSLPPSAGAALGALAQLRSLGVHLLELPADLVTGMQSLTQLNKLDVLASAVEPQLSLQRLSALTALRHLALRQAPQHASGRISGLPAPVTMPLPAAFPHLTSYTFAFATPSIKVWPRWGGGGGMRGANRWRLALRNVMGKSCAAALQVGAAELCRCNYAVGTHPSSPGRLIGCLDVCRISVLPSLQDLLAGLLPPGQPLSYLELDHCQLPADAVQGCPLLARLPALLFNSCTGSGGGVTEALEQLLRHAAALEALSCVGVLGTSRGYPVLPPCLVAKTGIKKLCLRQNRVEHLPAGPYLTGASGWRLGNCTAAPCLLAMSCLVATPGRVPLYIFRALPPLSPQPPSTLAPGLELLDIGGENLSHGHLPLSLATAVALRDLVLNKSSRLRISLQDVGEVLAHMPALRRLEVASATMSAGVAKRVAEALPHVKVVRS